MYVGTAHARCRDLHYDIERGSNFGFRHICKLKIFVVFHHAHSFHIACTENNTSRRANEQSKIKDL